jgi:flagellar protein FlbB
VRRTFLVLLAAAALSQPCAPGPGVRQAGAAEGGARSPARQGAEEAAALDAKRQQLADKEAALKAKEEALRKLSGVLDARVAELNAAKKGLEGALVNKKKQDDERYKKMIKIYKGLKADQAGALLDKLDSKMVIEMLNQMDQKTAIKLIPFISQPRVLEWTRLNLHGE